MQASNAPTKSAVPFANSGTKNTIPVASQIGITPGLASFTDGFPPLTMTPLVAGGVPPYGADFNGILNFLSAATRWAQAGGSYIYDAAFATAVGGYPKGALLVRSDLSGLWLNTVENNTANPDTGGAGWTNPLAGRLLNVRYFTTPGVSTYTPTPGTSFVRVRMQAGGGAGGGAVVTNASQVSVGIAGSAGSYGEAVFNSGFSGVSITIGAGGTGVAGANGGAGGTSSFGALLTVPGGIGGAVGPASTPSPLAGQNGPTSAPTGAAVFIRGEGGYGGIASTTTVAQGGRGGQSAFGVGGNVSSPATAGNPSSNYGAGGGSAANVNSAAATFAGGNGMAGVAIIEEYSV